MPGAALVRVPILIALALGLVEQVPAHEPKPDLHLVITVLARRALDRPIAGLSIAVARSGVVFESRGFGLADVDHQTPVGPRTIVHVDPVSKYIGAAVVLRLAEQGRLTLDDDITRYVPDAPTGGRRVTIRQLLAHTSGLLSITSVPGAEANEGRDLSHAQVLDLIRDRPADFAPGTSWRYSDTAFYLTGITVERVTGMSYAAYLREQVFAPLGMTSSSRCTAKDDVPGLARAYDVRAGSLVPAAPASWTVPFAAGGVCRMTRGSKSTTITNRPFGWTPNSVVRDRRGDASARRPSARRELASSEEDHFAAVCVDFFALRGSSDAFTYLNSTGPTP